MNLDYSNCKIIRGRSARLVKRDFLIECIKHCNKNKGVAMEFGVARGKSIKVIAKQTGLLTFGFDSWEGLPTDWNVGDKIFQKGHFKTPIPDPASLGPNVLLVKGEFKHTLKHFTKSLNFDISFIHIDCDLYSSAYTVLKSLDKFISPGTIIAFDEIENFANTKHKSTNKHNEKLALLRWMEKYKRKAVAVVRTNWYQAAYKIVN